MDPDRWQHALGLPCCAHRLHTIVHMCALADDAAPSPCLLSYAHSRCRHLRWCTTHARARPRSHNKLAALPATIVRLPKLSTLIASYNSSVSALPARLSCLTSLQDLQMSHCGLKLVPQVGGGW